ncbi:MAG: helicase [Proteobacteria bacterium]|nr:helicase [Pseudomonadota bacterium]
MILSGRGVTAVLGPTNTGKTHYAIERMVAHGSGVIGLPLRLLAREVYTRVVEKVGAQHVALVTGEEKIAPPGARFSVCTVEAMPRETKAAFVAIDEVQLAGDLERGHIFTDRILHLRGREETLLLGAGTMRPILEQVLPGILVIERPRMSQLVYSGSKKITRLPERSAIVAFSADEVYAIAELIRRQRGGAAVVLGALSPRTRNAQVGLYQAGDVDYLVATDAIGMGLNLDVDHVAFAQDRKFDGYQFRNLNPGELGQIAGRAGRHMRDGTFGVTGRVEPFDDELVERIETHAFDAVKVMQWRTAEFDFSSIRALQQSLDAAPKVQGLTRALPATDAQALDYLARYPEVVDLATTPARVERLWEACALPDYRRITPAQHADLILALYSDLVRHGTINEDFLAEQAKRADRTDGEIDTLSARIAQIRTWTYVSNRPGWLADPTHWQEKTREIEDRLSDALHDRLTKRFVDRRTTVLMRRLRENAMLEAEISVNGDVFVEGHHVGQLAGFRFTPAQGMDGPDGKAVEAAAMKALALEFEARAARLHAASNNDLALDSRGLVRWLGEPVGRLTASENIMRPRIILLADEQLTGNARDHVAARIERFVNHHITTVLKPLDDLSRAEDLQGLARGLAFQLVEALGSLFRREVADDIKTLDQDARASIRRYGVRFGAYHIFIPALLKPAPAELITLLWALKNDGLEKPGYGELIPVLAAGRTSIVTDNSFERTFYKLAGFRFLGKRAVRIDILERLADLIRPLLQWKPGTTARPDGAYDGRRFVTTTAMLSILGATPDDMEEILKGLGYRADSVSAEEAHAFLNADKPAEDAATAADATTEGAEHSDEADADSATEEAQAEAVAEAPAAEPVAAAAEEATAEPKPVLLWRPGGRNDNARQRPQGGERRGHGGNNRAPQGERREGDARRGDRKSEGERSEGGKRPERHDRKGGERQEHHGKRFEGKRDDRRNDNKRDNQRFEARPPKKEKPLDPDSPFAKLAALRDQLKK